MIMQPNPNLPEIISEMKTGVDLLLEVIKEMKISNDRIIEVYQRQIERFEKMKSMGKILVVVFLFGLVGCHKKDHKEEAVASLPDVMTVTGMTSSDFDAIQNVPIKDRNITVRIKTPGATSYRPLNNYEFQTSDTANWVWFRKAVILQGGSLFIPGTPAVPLGSLYEITSTNALTEKSFL